MRASTEPDDIGYCLTSGMRVFLDGNEQKYALTADEELGYIKRLVEPFFHNGETVTEEVYGVVKIEK